MIGPDATLRHTICHAYETWLRDERGLATASIDALMWEARHFLAWQLDRGGTASLIELSIRDIDLYMDARTPGLRRKSLKDVAERLRSLPDRSRHCAPALRLRRRALDRLRASVPQKVIGDLLGHRSTESTIPYLKLAAEDLRAIALDVPGSEVLS